MEHECISALDSDLSRSYGHRSVPRIGNQYGHVRWANHEWAHRVVWAAHNGAIPPGVLIRHSCDNPVCVQPYHLLTGTVADNQKDMADRGRGRNQNSDIERCARGHLLSGANLYVTPDGKHRHCRSCKNTARREARRK